MKTVSHLLIRRKVIDLQHPGISRLNVLSVFFLLIYFPG